MYFRKYLRPKSNGGIMLSYACVRLFWNYIIGGWTAYAKKTCKTTQNTCLYRNFYWDECVYDVVQSPWENQMASTCRIILTISRLMIVFAYNPTTQQNGFPTPLSDGTPTIELLSCLNNNLIDFYTFLHQIYNLMAPSKPILRWRSVNESWDILLLWENLLLLTWRDLSVDKDLIPQQFTDYGYWTGLTVLNNSKSPHKIPSVSIAWPLSLLFTFKFNFEVIGGLLLKDQIHSPWWLKNWVLFIELKSRETRPILRDITISYNIQF